MITQCPPQRNEMVIVIDSELLSRADCAAFVAEHARANTAAPSGFASISRRNSSRALIVHGPQGDHSSAGGEKQASQAQEPHSTRLSIT